MNIKFHCNCNIAQLISKHTTEYTTKYDKMIFSMKGTHSLICMKFYAFRDIVLLKLTPDTTRNAKGDHRWVWLDNFQRINVS